MKKLIAFVTEAYQELRYKVSWPTWSELQASTQLVLVSFLILALILFIMDISSSQILNLFYKQVG